MNQFSLPILSFVTMRTSAFITKLIFLLVFSMACNWAWPDIYSNGLQMDVKRVGRVYSFTAAFDTPLTKCAAYRFLTDYETAKNIPGVVEVLAYRQSANKVKVQLTADQHVLIFNVRLHSAMDVTEKPFDSIAFTQLSGDLKSFQGNWQIESNPRGSTLVFKGLVEPDTLIPLFIIDHFVKTGLINKFSAIVQLTEKRKDMPQIICTD